MGSIAVAKEYKMIRVDAETYQRLKSQAHGTPMAAYLRELSYGDHSISGRLDRIESKLETKPNTIPTNPALFGVIPPEIIREFIEVTTPETAKDVIYAAFNELDNIKDLTDRQLKDKKSFWLAFIATLAGMTPEEKRAMIEKIDKDNGFDSSIGQG